MADPSDRRGSKRLAAWLTSRGFYIPNALSRVEAGTVVTLRIAVKARSARVGIVVRCRLL